MRRLPRALGRLGRRPTVPSHHTLGQTRKTVRLRCPRAAVTRPVGCVIITDETNVPSGYPLKKIQENNEAEIMGIVCDEARESYQPGIVVELESNAMEDLEENVARIVAWIDQWIKDNDGDGMDNQDSESE